MVLSEMRLREDLYASRRKSESEFLQKMLTASLKIWITTREMPHLAKQIFIRGFFWLLMVVYYIYIKFDC